jgi:hypothetical protein
LRSEGQKSCLLATSAGRDMSVTEIHGISKTAPFTQADRQVSLVAKATSVILIFGFSYPDRSHVISLFKQATGIAYTYLNPLKTGRE